MAPKKKTSKAVNRIASLSSSSGCCSAPEMSEAAMMPETTNAMPWAMV